MSTNPLPWIKSVLIVEDSGHVGCLATQECMYGHENYYLPGSSLLSQSCLENCFAATLSYARQTYTWAWNVMCFDVAFELPLIAGAYIW